ncbi:hypothetical protein ACTFO4_25400 [Bacillus cereus group sp. MYBKT14-1]|uniref:hypothetical protein n=1 Tax=unclassified Bacillus cereus group TaxID=2750818 RepID=UPI003F7958F5
MEELSIGYKNSRRFEGSMGKWMRSIDEREEEEELQRQEFKKIMMEMGYPPPDTMFPNEMNMVIEYRTEGKETIRKKFDEYIDNVYRKQDLEQIRDRWISAEWCKGRWGILGEAMDAYFLEKYSLIIPVLIIQAEGIIAQAKGHIGQMGGKKLKEYIEEILDDNSIKSFDDAITEFYKETVLVKFAHGDPIDSFLSRHAILHGADVNYPTKPNALKTILLFDYLFDKIDNLYSK